jgi:hypothetical protein
MNEPLEPPHDPTPSSPDTLPPQDEAAEESPDYDYDTEERDDTVIASALKKSLAVFGIAAVLIAGVVVAQGFLGEVEELATERAPLEVPEVPKRPDAEIPQVTFTDITAEAGIDFVHENGAYGDKLLPETMGGGCAFLDFDSDGDQDLLLVNSKRWDWDTRPKPKQPARLALYQNDGSGHFSDVTETWGLAVSLYGMGAAVGDFDNDGHPDLFISAVGHNRLFRNTGKRFVDVTEAARVAGADTAWSSSCGFFDADADGDLDLFVCNYVGWSKDFDLAQNFTLDGTLRAYGQPQKFPGSAPYLYLNNGDGTFDDVTKQAGIEVRNDGTNVKLAKSLGVAFADLNDDGHVDLVVANDTVRNFLFLGNGDGTFREEGRQSGIAFDTNGNARGAMGIDIGRFRNSDVLGIAIGNFANETTALYVRKTLADQLPVFQDEAVSNGIAVPTRPELTFGVFFFDSDLDGRLDIFAANGHLEADINLVQSSQHYQQPPQLLWNCGPQYHNEFVALEPDQCGKDFVNPMVGRGASFADIDGDGDLDLLITSVGGRPRLLRNDQQLGHHWLRVKLTGTTGVNRSAIGAWVDVHTARGTRSLQVMPTRSYLSQAELPVTFGLGEIDSVQKVVVRWPNGTIQQVDKPQLDSLIEITQAETTAASKEE